MTVVTETPVTAETRPTHRAIRRLTVPKDLDITDRLLRANIKDFSTTFHPRWVKIVDNGRPPREREFRIAELGFESTEIARVRLCVDGWEAADIAEQLEAVVQNRNMFLSSPVIAFGTPVEMIGGHTTDKWYSVIEPHEDRLRARMRNDARWTPGVYALLVR